MNAIKEIKAIWEQQHNHYPDDLQANIDMNEHYIFMSNAVEWLIQKTGEWAIAIQFDPVYHDVYEIDVMTFGEGVVSYRWVNPSYLHRYHNNNFEYQLDNSYVQELNVDYFPDKILGIARDVVDGIIVHPSRNNVEEDYETIELDMTDSEIALIARAAHAEDITINEFMNKVIKEELDRVLPDWREDVKESY